MSVGRRCGARTHRGGLCNNPPLPGKMRCYRHGSAGGRPPGTPQHPNTCAAAIEGRRRWVERMRAAKERGEVDRFPNGRRARGLPKRSKDRIIARGQRLIEQAIAEMAKAKKNLPAVPERPWEEKTVGEKFSANFEDALDFSHEVLNRNTNWEDIELLKLKKEIALAAQSQAIRIRVAELSPRSDDSVVNRLMQRVAALRRGERVIDIAPDDVAG